MIARFVASMAILVAGAAGNYFVTEQRVAAANFISEVMENMGQQRMLVQRIALLSRSLIDAPYKPTREVFRQEIRSSAQNLGIAHEDLIRGELSKKLPKSTLQKVQSIYLEPPFSLEKDIKQLLSSALSITETPDDSLNAENPDFIYVESLAQSNQLVNALNQVVGHYRSESAAVISRNVILGRIQLGAFLLVSAGLVMFVFVPMARGIRSEIDDLAKLNVVLDQHARDVSDTNKKLKDKESSLLEIMEDLAVQKKHLQLEIVERKKAEAALQQERNTAQMYLDLAGVMFILLDNNQVLRLVNRKGCELTGYTEGELLGQNWFDISLTPENRPTYKKIFDDFVTGKEALTEYIETDLLTKDGKIKRIAWHNTSLKDGNGNITGTLSSGEDITERVRAEKSQKELNEKLERINKELNEFSYVVSHDLKAPLRGIGSLATWLIDDYGEKLDPDAKESLDLMVGRVKRMSDLIDGLLLLAKLGSTEGEPKDVFLPALVKDVVDFINPPKSISILIADNLPMVRCDQTRIQQVFQNLLSNAIKYMDKPQGKVTVEAHDKDEFWEFSVQDNGPGIDKKYHEKIFQIFQTLAPRDTHDSTGVGLTIVKKIVESYGGRVRVDSAPGMGSTFFFTLPKAVERSLAHAA